MQKYCLGVDVGGTTVKIGFFTYNGNLLDKWEIKTRKEDNGSHILSDVSDSIKAKLTSKKIDKEYIKGIGIGVPGPITEDGTVLTCVNLGWGEFNVADKVKELTGISNVLVNNDANVAALGEMWKGGGKGYKSLIMITLGTGVGGGVICDGKIINGIRGAAGEIGHITVDFEEEDLCNCGRRGCLEQYASATGIVKETKRLLAKTDKATILREIQSFTAKDIFDAAKEGDEIALSLVEKFGRLLGIVTSQIAAVVDPEAFVIGGGVSKAGTILTDVVEKHYEANVMKPLKGRKFRLATLGNDAGIYGSAKMVIDEK